jgi:hypothetical protein
MIRQGDVLLVKVDEVPAEATKVKRDQRGRLIVAEGEATGHAHAIQAKSANLFEMGTFMYLEATRKVVLAHEEHENIQLDPGTYKISRQREYTPERIRQVAD